MRRVKIVFLMLVAVTSSTTADSFSMQTAFVPNGEIAERLAPFACDCDNMIENTFVEVECRCFGKELMGIPRNLSLEITKLTIIDSHLRLIEHNSMEPYRKTLKDVTLGNLPFLRVIEDGTFANILNLRTVYISHAPQLKVLNGLLNGITSKKFYSLRIVQTGLYEIPDLSNVPADNVVHLLDLDWNKIEKLNKNCVKIKAEQVTLNYNEISIVHDLAFNGSQIGKLNLRGNKKLKIIEPLAFKGLESLRELDLSETAIEGLPVAGLEELETLRVEKNSNMKTIPSIYDFASLKVTRLTHPFHCCAFKYPEQHDPQRHAQYEMKIKLACREGVSPLDTGQLKRRRRQMSALGNISDMGYESVPKGRGMPKGWTPNLEHFIDAVNRTDFFHLNPLVGKTIDHEAAQPQESDEDIGTFHEKSAEITPHNKVLAICGKLSTKTPSVKCYPEPNALNPCEDIMGFSWLRISVWFVVVLAVVGNLAVIIVLLFSGGEMTVSRFLMCNLAFADLCMGLYLLLIASMDLHSMGSYFNFAFDWQYGVGCQMAGFLTVFASHLSIFTLTVITVERWFAITYAIHLTRRIRIGAAAKIMLGGWFYSVLVAALPLFGVSNYSSTSICLPMEVNCLVDRVYLFSITVMNALAFALIVFCYAQIYLSLGYETRHSTTKGEMTIAKKMALLIFTDFATWAPISFFSITALAGYPLIGVTKSKILLVFFYPINSCANPYLYAIMTAQYRKDFFLLIARCGFCKKTARQYTLSTGLPTLNNSHPIPLLQKENGRQRNDKSNHDEDAAL